MTIREPHWESQLENNLELLDKSIRIIFNDLTRKQKTEVLAEQSLDEIIKWRQEVYRKEFVLVVDPLGVAGAAEVAREEALGNLFSFDEEE